MSSLCGGTSVIKRDGVRNMFFILCANRAWNGSNAAGEPGFGNMGKLACTRERWDAQVDKPGGSLATGAGQRVVNTCSNRGLGRVASAYVGECGVTYNHILWGVGGGWGGEGG